MLIEAADDEVDGTVEIAAEAQLLAEVSLYLVFIDGQLRKGRLIRARKIGVAHVAVTSERREAQRAEMIALITAAATISVVRGLDGGVTVLSEKIGRESCRERVCRYVEISVVG